MLIPLLITAAATVYACVAVGVALAMSQDPSPAPLALRLTMPPFWLPMLVWAWAWDQWTTKPARYVKARVPMTREERNGQAMSVLVVLLVIVCIAIVLAVVHETCKAHLYGIAPNPEVSGGGKPSGAAE